MEGERKGLGSNVSTNGLNNNMGICIAEPSFILNDGHYKRVMGNNVLQFWFLFGKGGT